MILRAKPEKDVVTVELEGHLDFETTQQFKETCETIREQHDCQRLVFDFTNLKFVGSSGINQFIQAMKEINTGDDRPKLCHLSTEFERVFKAFQTNRNPFHIHENVEEAIAAFDAPKPQKRKRAAKKKDN